MELQADLDAAEVNQRPRGATKSPASADRKMDVGGIGKLETAGGVRRRGTDRSVDTQPRWHADACRRADWSDVYELSKKVHRDANSTALRGRPILICPPQRGQFQVRVSEATGGLGGSRG